MRGEIDKRDLKGNYLHTITDMSDIEEIEGDEDEGIIINKNLINKGEENG